MLTIRVGFVVLGQATSSEVDKRKLWRVNCCLFPLKFYCPDHIWKWIINRFVYYLFKRIPLPQEEFGHISRVFQFGIHYVAPPFGNKTGVDACFMTVSYGNWDQMYSGYIWVVVNQKAINRFYFTICDFGNLKLCFSSFSFVFVTGLFGFVPVLNSVNQKVITIRLSA
jgi:hypothetical protein